MLAFTIEGMSHLQPSGSTRAWRALREYILRRDRYLCRIGTPGVCTAVATCVDHVVPREEGGGDEETNLRAGCEPCNLERNNARIRARHEPAPRRVSSW